MTLYLLQIDLDGIIVSTVLQNELEETRAIDEVTKCRMILKKGKLIVGIPQSSHTPSGPFLVQDEEDANRSDGRKHQK